MPAASRNRFGNTRVHLLALASCTGETDMEPIAVSVRDAAKALSLGRTSIYAMIGDGRLDSFKVGRRTLITMSSIRGVVGIPASPAQP
jgi:excisionase family DNA binding protein